MKKNQYFVGLILLALTSYFNLGFHHPDEHFQILEILSAKTNPAFDPSWLPWDLNEKLRSYFQIFLYWPFELIFNKLGFSPFLKVFFYKWMTASFGFIGLMKYAGQIKFNKNYLLIFFWFVPLFLARTSSESLSMGFFFWGIYFLNHKTSRYYFFAGLFFSFSCYARFPMLVAVSLVAMWVAFYHEKEWKLGLIDFGFICGVGIGACIDYWGYGEWTLSVWNYFKANIIESKGNQFGVEPVWYFLIKPALKAGPIGILLLAGVINYWFKRSKSQLTFWTLGYTLIHSFISHKEIRFIAPVYLVSPIMLMMVWKDWHPIFRKVFKVFFIINLIYLLKIVFISNTSYIEFYRFLYKQDNQGKGEKIYTLYDEHGTHLKLINRYYLKDITKELIPVSKDDFVRMKKPFFMLSSQYREIDFIKKHHCHELYSIYPNWLLEKNPFNFAKRSSVWKYWRCQIAEKNHLFE